MTGKIITVCAERKWRKRHQELSRFNGTGCRIPQHDEFWIYGVKDTAVPARQGLQQGCFWPV